MMPTPDTRPPDVQAAMRQAATEARTLGHTVGAFAVELHHRGERHEITIWGAHCACDAEVYVKATTRRSDGRRRITRHGAAIEEPHGPLHL
jgi:hypothetical protein